MTTGIGRTGVVGLMRNGEGSTVMLCAGMDALPRRRLLVCLTPVR